MFKIFQVIFSNELQTIFFTDVVLGIVVEVTETVNEIKLLRVFLSEFVKRGRFALQGDEIMLLVPEREASTGFFHDLFVLR